MTESNIIELEAIVGADGGWFLNQPGSKPVWTNKCTEQTAKRFLLREAAEFVKQYRKRAGDSAMKVWLKIAA